MIATKGQEQWLDICIQSGRKKINFNSIDADANNNANAGADAGVLALSLLVNASVLCV